MIKSTYLLGFFAVMMLNVPASVYGMAQSKTDEVREVKNEIVRIESQDTISFHCEDISVSYDKRTGKYSGERPPRCSYFGDLCEAPVGLDPKKAEDFFKDFQKGFEGINS